MTNTKDTTTMTGAEFMRHVGTDPHKWAEAFIAAHDEAFVPDGDGLRSETAERVDAAAKWFRDYAEVKVAEALRGETDSACQRTS
jgi:hypothetical protein